jgi:hypothetical protein
MADYSQLFVGYADGLTTLDPELILPHYAYPCMMLTNDFVGALNSEDELRQALTQANDFYRQFGVTEVSYEVTSVDQITPSIARVHLQWTFRSGGTKLLDSEYEYILRGDKIHVVISIDEQEKIAALIRRS